jgi:hypothetical protein
MKTTRSNLGSYLAICTAEDRKWCEPGLRLLLTSLCRYSSDIAITVFYPEADQEFFEWARDLEPVKITVRSIHVAGAYGWNVKPQVLLQLLDEGNREAVWVDSDIIATKDVLRAFSGLGSDVLVATEEGIWGPRDEKGALRARLWGFQVKREFPFPLNTAVLRVTQDHIPLLKRWKEILESPEYRCAQQKSFRRRPPHMHSDQDVLTALLSSEEFHNVPVKILRRGHDIIQYLGPWGFTLAERLTCMVKGMPMFIHSQGPGKPWVEDIEVKAEGLGGKLQAGYGDLSPYILAAKTLVPELSGTWGRPRSKLTSALRIVGFGYPQLVGLPIAAAFDLRRVLSWYFPSAIAALEATVNAKRMRRHFRDAFLSRQIRMKARIYDRSDPVVLSGPFAGMKYFNEVVWGSIEPRWLGTYEQELHPIIERIFQTNYCDIINVGSAEGYYAVGLAVRFPLARVHSYDIDPWARSQQRRLARLNRANNIEIRKSCTREQLTDCISERTLLICDIEGGEYDLLNPDEVPALHRCDILVELHDHGGYGFTPQSGAEELAGSFSASHEITQINVAPSRSDAALDVTLRAKLTAQELTESMEEHGSPGQLWLWLKARP